ncbi:MAG: Uma2 family endonuclease [Myxococcales bacterium]|nr:Uma2 family endonuclease [Myxococcales bacterium]
MKPAARKRTVSALDPPDTDNMGRSILQTLISELLRPFIARFLRQKSVRAFVGANQFFYFDATDITRRIAPDVYVLPGIEGPREERVWCTWDLVEPPSFAFEIVGRDMAKDYEDVPIDYKAIGVRELIVYDPDWTLRSRRRVRWQVWRQVKKRGLVCVLESVESSVLGCFLRVVGEGGARRVRLATGRFGDELVATDEELAAQTNEALERAEAELARREVAEREREAAERESEAAERDREAAERAKEAAIRERDLLAAKLAALESRPPPRKRTKR